MGRPWHERGTYGNIIKGLIQKQMASYDRHKDPIKRTKIAQNIGYLIQVQTGLINSYRNIEGRIENLEHVVELVRKRSKSND